MSLNMRINAMRGMDLGYAARLYAEIKATPARGPRLTMGEWKALGPEGQDTLKDFLEPWEIAIVEGWNAQMRVRAPLSPGRLFVRAALCYAVFCVVFAFVHGLKSTWYGQGFHFHVWQCATIEVPGIIWSDLSVKEAAQQYIDTAWMTDVEPSPSRTWRVVRLPDDRGWSVALKYKVLPPRGYGTDLSACLIVRADHFGYYVRRD